MDDEPHHCQVWMVLVQEPNPREHLQELPAVEKAAETPVTRGTERDRQGRKNRIKIGDLPADEVQPGNPELLC